MVRWATCKCSFLQAPQGHPLPQEQRQSPEGSLNQSVAPIYLNSPSCEGHAKMHIRLWGTYVFTLLQTNGFVHARQAFCHWATSQPSWDFFQHCGSFLSVPRLQTGEFHGTAMSLIIRNRLERTQFRNSFTMCTYLNNRNSNVFLMPAWYFAESRCLTTAKRKRKRKCKLWAYQSPAQINHF